MRISVLLLVVEALCIPCLPQVLLADGNASKQIGQEAPAKRKMPKDPLFITDMDLENLYDEWEDADDEKLPPDELPPHKRPPGYRHPSAPTLGTHKQAEEQLMKDPEAFMVASKRGKTVMAFVTVAGKPTKEDTDELTQRWQVGLSNNHLKCERYVIEKDRAIFVFEDGSQAFEAKTFLLDQPELKEYTIDNRSWQGKGYPVEYPNASGDSRPSSGGKKVEEPHKSEQQAGKTVKRDEL